MPSEYINNPKHWSDRAAEMRAVADTMKESETRATILRLAGDYDKLAARAAERANGQRPGRSATKQEPDA